MNMVLSMVNNRVSSAMIRWNFFLPASPKKWRSCRINTLMNKTVFLNTDEWNLFSYLEDQCKKKLAASEF